MNTSHYLKIFLSIPVFYFSMLLIGCDADQSTASSSTSSSSPSSRSSSLSSEAYVMSNVDNGSSRQMKVGETLEVTLPENSTSESKWNVDEVNSSILYEFAEEYDEEYDYDPIRYNLVCNGKTTLRFVAIGQGQTPLRIVYRQPEKTGALTTVSPIDTFEINVMIANNQ
jgi:predicted secreted protein